MLISRREVQQLLVEDSGRVNGVLLADVSPYLKQELAPNNVLPADFVRAIEYSDYSSVLSIWVPFILVQRGKHVINLFIQYTPYKPRDGNWEDPVYRESFAQSCFTLIDEYAPGFRTSVIGYDMLTPPDLEREIGLTGGNVFHGAMGSNYRTHCVGCICVEWGPSRGGVMGAPGRNAAHVVLQDVKK
ncbi:hypothetical protein FNV43_RR19076 [Rhamnella rubrinervis]|uniref:Amine oxidase n=1 Tax=Rhamnella rubrinervis TaxID=2594499 RepID=A0A8K0E7I6_9ROSA|nr:hypothetical protein FNV43_RR19076 [Rhamnella rubrinervis]